MLVKSERLLLQPHLGGFELLCTFIQHLHEIAMWGHSICGFLEDHFIQKLQLLNNAVLWAVVGLSKHAHMIFLLQELHWLPTYFWVPFKVLTWGIDYLLYYQLDQFNMTALVCSQFLQSSSAIYWEPISLPSLPWFLPSWMKFPLQSTWPPPSSRGP